MDRSQQGLCDLVGNYFVSLYAPSSNEAGNSSFLNAVTSNVSTGQNESLTREFCLEEFSKAVHQMHPDKSPGLDSFNPFLFQKCWATVGEYIFRTGVE